MRASVCVLFALVVTTFFSTPHAQTRRTLDIYVVDVEGGNATLFVAPSGASVLIDSGNPGAAATRDADRIAAAAKDAGLSRIDHLITTHWHADHFGAMAEVAKRIPIGNFIDHGPSIQPAAATDDFLKTVYPALHGAARHTMVRAGDRVAIEGVDWRIVSAGGEMVKAALPGAGRTNPFCADAKPREPDPTENAQSVGSVATFGRFRVAHLGDLTWNKELDLMCPTNRIGTVDLFVVSHHGQASSNSPALVHAIESRVALINNGTRKGAQPDAMRVLFTAPGLEDLWQIHFSLLSGQEYTVPGLFIANAVDEPPPAIAVAPMPPPPPGPATPPPPAHNGAAHWLKVSAERDGTFTVTNARNGFSKTYRARAR
jgi:competence protein ComEC